jgi:polar amino acid transport system ATP-binding protein/sulfate transport system ATP-binding protein
MAVQVFPCEYTDTLLKVENVSMALGGKPVLHNLNLEIKNLVRPGLTQGQVVALLGPSGVGKTTLFRILAGLDVPDSGSVLIKQEGIPVQRGMVGVVAQHYPLFRHRTVLGNLTVAGRQANLSSREALTKARDLLKRFGLEEQENKYPPQLSGGQRQRVAITQQFMCSDHFLLMDEPFSGLDVVAVEQVVRLITDIAATDELKTFIVVTHDVAAAIEVADTIWVMGRDRAPDGSPIPGARIQASYNLVERGLAWREGVTNTPEYLDLYREIRSIFPRL